ncbi:MAG: AI-2E family transporter [Rhodobacteraceae bacterium]|nr:AI-2E family transporter [Paracoccaceae bacterium]
MARSGELGKSMHGPASETQTSSRIETASQILAGFALFFILEIHVLGALLSGLLVYQLTQYLVPLVTRFGVRLTLVRAVALSVVAIIIGVPIALGIIELSSWIARGVSNIAELLQRMAQVITTARNQVPGWALEYMPSNIEDFQASAAGWLTKNAGQIGLISQDVGRLLFHIIIGMIIGGMLAFQAGTFGEKMGPLAKAMTNRVETLAAAFKNVVFSQILISALNTTLTAIYLAVLLPLFGTQVPLVKTLIAVTFIAGLLPVIGNLISNSVIVIVSLSVSPITAAVSLVYLVVIHKLEYFFNARIIGSQISARAWELLIVLLVMESVFGVPGIIAGPIYYAYLKRELANRGLI